MRKITKITGYPSREEALQDPRIPTVRGEPIQLVDGSWAIRGWQWLYLPAGGEIPSKIARQRGSLP